MLIMVKTITTTEKITFFPVKDTMFDNGEEILPLVDYALKADRITDGVSTIMEVVSVHVRDDDPRSEFDCVYTDRGLHS